MSTQDIENYSEEAPFKVSGIGIHNQHPKAIHKGGKQQDEPADPGVVHVNGVHQDKHRQVRPAAQHCMNLVAEYVRFSSVLLPAFSQG